MYTWALIQSNYCKNLAKNLLSLIIAHKCPQMQEPILPDFKNRGFFGYVSGKLPTYPSPKATLTLTSHIGKNFGLGEGLVGSFPETYNDPLIKAKFSLVELSNKFKTQFVS